MIADRIRKIRLSKDISQETMAFGLKISQSAYSKIEAKKTKIDFVRIQEIAILLGCTTSEIITYGDFDGILKSIADLQEKILELEKNAEKQQMMIEKLLNKK